MVGDYDIRGHITQEFVYELGQKFGKECCVMHDKKESSKNLSRAFLEGIRDSGATGYYCGEGPTDMNALAGKFLGCYSVMFTASHLSNKLDGIKFHYPNSVPFLGSEINEILNSKKKKGIGNIINYSFKQTYLEEVIKRCNYFGINLNGMKFNIDEQGALSKICLKKLGATIGNSKLRLVNDFDGDRVNVFYDGKLIHPSLVSCVLTKYFGKNIVATIDSLSILSDYANVYYSRVGDPFVSRTLLKTGRKFSTEASGHYIDTDFVFTSSGTLFSLLIAGISKELFDFLRNKNLKYEIKSVKSIDMYKFKGAKKICGAFEITNNKGRAVIRKSSTEPVYRILLEGDITL